jgi:PIN domain nuclease of toxin-antitoxin system
VTALGCAVLAIEQPHLRVLASLDMHHRDPFDRMLVAQAKHEDMTLVTGDDVLRAYGVPILWAKRRGSRL